MKIQKIHRFIIFIPIILISLKSLFSSCLVLSNGNYNNNKDTLLFLHPLDTLDSIMNHYNNLGIDYLTQGDYINAEMYLIKTLEIRTRIYSEFDRRLAATYTNLGILYEKIWNYELALDHYNKAEEIYLHIDSNHVHIGSIYVNKAIVYRNLRDYDKAISYCENALKVFNKQPKLDYEKISITYFNLGIINEFAGDPQKAIEYFKKSLLFDKNKSKSLLLRVYNSLSINYSKLGNLDLAENYYKASLAFVNSNISNTDMEFVATYINYGIFQLDYKKNLPLAKQLLFYVLNNYNPISGYRNPQIPILYHNIGELYLTYNNLDSALYYFQLSLISEDVNFNDTDILTNPIINLKTQRTRIINTLKFKAETFLKLYYTKNDQLYLEKSLETYILIFDYFDKIRLKYESEQSMFILSEQENDTYLKGVDIAYKLYRLTDNKNYLKIIHEINEKRKAFSLLTSLRKVEAMEFGGIPPHLLREENELYRQIGAYEELIYEERKHVNADRLKLELWEDRLFKLNQEYEKLINRFELEYTDYYELKYNVKVTPIRSIQEKISDDQTVVEYAISDSIIYYFVISPDEIKFNSIPIDSTFYHHIKVLTSDMAAPNFSSGARQAFADFTESAYALYRILLEPCSEMIRGKSLTIIPDGILSYLPFEALLTHPVISDEPDYRNLPYLVRDYDIGYSYSATLQFEKHRRMPASSGRLLAFAPDYSNLYAQSSPQSSFLDVYRNQLVPLPGVKDEVKSISRLIKGKVFMDRDATESNFKRYASGYDILHLAMHTIVDNENPMYSKLAFTQRVDSLEDGFLNTYEIYNMKYNARMAVLSSCKTGFGKLQKGEGVMSLARGFMYAGCPSIVMTLWEVSDKSGSRLMENFYRHLKKGDSKTRALRQAKLDFLKKADQLKANPYFWSTYVIIGDPEPLYKSATRTWWIPLSLILLAIAVSFIIIILKKPEILRKKTNHSFKQDTMYT